MIEGLTELVSLLAGLLYLVEKIVEWLIRLYKAMQTGKKKKPRRRRKR